jgi:hypothetical protein
MGGRPDAKDRDCRGGRGDGVRGGCQRGATEQVQAEREELIQERQEGEAIGGAGEAGAMSLRGTVESKKADKLTLNTDQGKKDLIVTTDTELVHLGRDIRIEDIVPGAEVRASYNIEANRWVADRVELLDPSGKDKSKKSSAACGR